MSNSVAEVWRFADRPVEPHAILVDFAKRAVARGSRNASSRCVFVFGDLSRGIDRAVQDDEDALAARRRVSRRAERLKQIRRSVVSD